MGVSPNWGYHLGVPIRRIIFLVWICMKFPLFPVLRAQSGSHLPSLGPRINYVATWAMLVGGGIHGPHIARLPSSEPYVTLTRG